MTNPAIKKQKQILRSQLLSALQKLTPDQRQTASRSICAQITRHLSNNPHVSTITSFANLPFEPDLSSLHDLNPHLKIGYPHATHEGSMTFHHVVNPAEMSKGYYGLRQPVPDPATLIAPDQIQLLLTPAFAFTTAGHRLGKGGGYYDRFIANLTPKTQIVGVAFQCQIIPHIPTEPHDQPIPKIISA